MGGIFPPARNAPLVRYVRGHGGTLSHALQAIGEFHARHDRWPTRLHLHPLTLAALVVDVTPLGFYLLQQKIELIADAEHDFLVTDKHGGTHAYQLQTRPQPAALAAAAAWVGYAVAESAVDLS